MLHDLSSGIHHSRNRSVRAAARTALSRASAARNRLDDLLEPSQDLARWLQEAGRRQHVRGQTSTVSEDLDRGRKAAALSCAGALRRPLILALLALSYLQYFFADVSLKIMSLHSFIVFLFT